MKDDKVMMLLVAFFLGYFIRRMMETTVVEGNGCDHLPNHLGIKDKACKTKGKGCSWGAFEDAGIPSTTKSRFNPGAPLKNGHVKDTCSGPGECDLTWLSQPSCN